jgi:CSLREA domain-containing protein
MKLPVRRFALASVATVMVLSASTSRAAELSFTVTTTEDAPDASCAAAGTCSLRAALSAAGAAPGPATIKLPAGKYSVKASSIAVKGHITVSGDGRDRTSIDAGGVPAALDVVGGSLNLTGLTMKGGPIQATDTDLVLRDVTLQDSGSDSDGGAVSVTRGSLQIDGADFDSNGGKNGGALFVEGVAVKIRKAKFSGNGAWESGGAIFASHSTVLDIQGTSFSGNSARLGGGALFADGYTSAQGAHLFVTDSHFDDNSALDAGGAVEVNSTSNSVDQLQLTLSKSTFSTNLAGNGGALAVQQGDVVVDQSTFTANRAANTAGGAVWAAGGSLRVSGSQFQRNDSAGSGGAISAAGTTIVASSSFNANTAATLGGALALPGFTVPTVQADTFSANVADTGQPDIWRGGNGQLRRVSSAAARGNLLSAPIALAALAALLLIVALVVLVLLRSRSVRRRARSAG